MDTAEKAFGAFHAELIAGVKEQHNAAKEALKRKCAEQMARLIREQQIDIDELHDLDPQALVAKCLPSTTTAAAEEQEGTADEVLVSDSERHETPEPQADHKLGAAAVVTAKKRPRISTAHSQPAVKRHAQSVISIVSDNAASTSHQPPASPPASITSVASSRPQRARKPPPPREIDYSKEKRVVRAVRTRINTTCAVSTDTSKPEPKSPVEAPSEPPEPAPPSLDVQFCHHIMNLIRGARAAQLFLHPVDPVEFPTYYNIISRPMDLSTMASKLEQGEYKNAEESKADFDLMIKNCLAFNPSGEEARDLGIMLDRHFSNEWNWRPEWEKEVRRKRGGKKA